MPSLTPLSFLPSLWGNFLDTPVCLSSEATSDLVLGVGKYLLGVGVEGREKDPAAEYQ